MITQFDDYKLCLVMDNWAYFTTQDLDKQWGDGWGCIPYSDNAGSPYTSRSSDVDKWDILKVAYESELEPPCEYAYDKYSVQIINKKAVAWLTDRYSKKVINIYAGDSVKQFVRWIYASGGKTYFSLDILHKKLFWQTILEE